MKKLAVLAMIACMLVFGSDRLFAYAFGGKLIYNKMMDDYSDVKFENNLSGGIFFEVGPAFLGSKFRPGFDYVTLETSKAKFARVYAVHLDLTWFLMKGSFAPFLGFGPSLNYYNFNSSRSKDDDSDAGIEGFGGFEYNFTGPWSLYVEIRLTQHDIADLGARLIKGSAGIVYYF